MNLLLKIMVVECLLTLKIRLWVKERLAWMLMNKKEMIEKISNGTLLKVRDTNCGEETVYMFVRGYIDGRPMCNMVRMGEMSKRGTLNYLVFVETIEELFESPCWNYLEIVDLLPSEEWSIISKRNMW